MKLTEIERDVEASNEGVWVEMTGGWGAKVRSTTNPNYQRLESKHLQANRRFFMKNQLPPPEHLRAQRLELVVKTLIVDWSNIENDDGESVKFSDEKARELFSDPRYQSMLDETYEVANENETFRREALKAESKSTS